MIVTLTPNPAIDRTLTVDRLVPGAVHRASDRQVEPSGKGVNVSRALVGNGFPTLALFPAGGAEGTQLRALLDAEGVPYAAAPIEGAVRVNVSFVSADGLATKVNEVGPRLREPEVKELLQLLDTRLARATSPALWVVASGTLAPGMPAGYYAEAAERAREYGGHVVVDSSGSSLAASLPARPDVLKPNVAELAELVGRIPETIGEVVAAAEEVRRETAGVVVVSLGAAGAVLVDAHGALHAEGHVHEVCSTVGAGDSLLAGYVAGRLVDPDAREDALREAVAWGSVAVRAAGSRAEPVRAADRAMVAVSRMPDDARRLKPDTPADPASNTSG